MRKSQIRMKPMKFVRAYKKAKIGQVQREQYPWIGSRMPRTMTLSIGIVTFLTVIAAGTTAILLLP
jgi:hypothetical protein